HVLRALGVDAAGGLGQVIDGFDGVHAGQRFGLKDVGGHHGGVGDDVLAQRVVGVQRGAGFLALADQRRVEHHVGEGSLRERLGDGVDGGGRAEHPDLDDVQVVGGGGGLDLVGDHLGLDRYEAVGPVVVRVKGDD